MNIHLSFKEQLSKLIDENINTYPDAIDWIVSQMSLIDIESKKTKAESIMEALIGDTEFFNNPLEQGGSNKDFIVWYVTKYNCTTKYAIERLLHYCKQN
ncbi:hypothetical protein MIJ3_00030 [Pseudomonas phage vB_PaeM_MIJ3]|nr:hypothetical protein MIJ3_00030 [Pseudomonas phage vB_PaeM_MIJ3]